MRDRCRYQASALRFEGCDAQLCRTLAKPASSAAIRRFAVGFAPAPIWNAIVQSSDMTYWNSVVERIAARSRSAVISMRDRPLSGSDQYIFGGKREVLRKTADDSAESTSSNQSAAASMYALIYQFSGQKWSCWISSVRPGISEPRKMRLQCRIMSWLFSTSKNTTSDKPLFVSSIMSPMWRVT